MARRKLTEAEWDEVFRIRCKSKRGEASTDEERDLIDRAFRQDKKRYADEQVDVFNATVPFGSCGLTKKQLEARIGAAIEQWGRALADSSRKR